MAELDTLYRTQGPNTAGKALPPLELEPTVNLPAVAHPTIPNLNRTDTKSRAAKLSFETHDDEHSDRIFSTWGRLSPQKKSPGAESKSPTRGVAGAITRKITQLRSK